LTLSKPSNSSPLGPAFAPRYDGYCKITRRRYRQGAAIRPTDWYGGGWAIADAITDATPIDLERDMSREYSNH
jgi:hypothetical protein